MFSVHLSCFMCEVWKLRLGPGRRKVFSPGTSSDSLPSARARWADCANQTLELPGQPGSVEFPAVSLPRPGECQGTGHTARTGQDSHLITPIQDITYLVDEGTKGQELQENG